MEFDLLAKTLLVLVLIFFGYRYLWLPYRRDPLNKKPVEILQDQVLILKKSLFSAIEDIQELKEKKPNKFDIIEATDELKRLADEFLKTRDEADQKQRSLKAEFDQFRYEVREFHSRVERDMINCLKAVKTTHYHYTVAEPKQTKRKTKTTRG